MPSPVPSPSSSTASLSMPDALHLGPMPPATAPSPNALERGPLTPRQALAARLDSPRVRIPTAAWASAGGTLAATVGGALSGFGLGQIGSPEQLVPPGPAASVGALVAVAGSAASLIATGGELPKLGRATLLDLAGAGAGAVAGAGGALDHAGHDVGLPLAIVGAAVATIPPILPLGRQDKFVAPHAIGFRPNPPQEA